MIIDLIPFCSVYGINPPKGVIHVGAHYGEEYELYTFWGITRSIWFEPIKKSFEILNHMIGKKPGVTVLPYALGSVNSKSKMFTETANTGFSSSLLEPKVHKEQYPWIEFNGEEEVTVTTLDDAIAIEAIRGSDLRFFVLDVQGYELEVLKGATESLKNIDVIYSEVNRAELYKGCPMIEDLDNYLQSFKRVKTEWVGNTWGEAVWVRK